MKPCDCKNRQDKDKMEVQGITINDNSIRVRPPVVILTTGSCTMKITQSVFKSFAHWYFGDQKQSIQWQPPATCKLHDK